MEQQVHLELHYLSCLSNLGCSYYAEFVKNFKMHLSFSFLKHIYPWNVRLSGLCVVTMTAVNGRSHNFHKLILFSILLFCLKFIAFICLFFMVWYCFFILHLNFLLCFLSSDTFRCFCSGIFHSDGFVLSDVTLHRTTRPPFSFFICKQKSQKALLAVFVT